MTDLTAALLSEAMEVGRNEAEMAEEWLRLVGTGVNGFEASKRVDLDFARRHRVAIARYEIALAALKKGDCSCPR